MLPVISRALTPAPRARRAFALTLALALGAVPVTSAMSAQPAAHAVEAHAAEPAAANYSSNFTSPRTTPATSNASPTSSAP